MKLVQFGAGNIGRGFIGALFSKGGYEVVFIDVNEAIITALNERRCYTQCVVSHDGETDVRIENVRAVDGRDIARVADEIATADLLSTSVGVNALPHICESLIAGFRKRWAAGERSIDLLICENLMDANHYLDALLRQRLEATEIDRYQTMVGLVETSIGRMVPIMTPEMQRGDPLRVCVEPYDFLPVDRDAFRATPPDLPNVVPYTPFSFYLKRKLYLHNMGHALAAYLGHYAGKHMIYESLAVPAIAFAVLRAMTDAAHALSIEYGMSAAALDDHIMDLLYRFHNAALGDTVARVGADIPRKLAPNDRLVGALRTVQGVQRDPAFIALGIAAAVWQYVDEHACDPAETLRTLTKLDPDEPVFADILRYEAMMHKGVPIDELIHAVQSDIARRRAPLL